MMSLQDGTGGLAVKDTWHSQGGIKFQIDTANHLNGFSESMARSEITSPAPAQEQNGDSASVAGSQSAPSYHDHICSHLYHNGYINGMYADMIIRLHAINGSTGLPSTNAVAMDGIGFKLHRIIAVRSPYLASLLNEAEVNGDHYQPHPVTITVPTNDPNLSPDGISMALGHLYASFAQTMLAQHSMQSPVARSAFLRSCLAAANLFHLQDLAAMVTDYIKGDISRATVLEYCRFVSQQEWGGSYGTSQQIRECVLEYLHKGIVRELAELAPVWGNKDGETYRELVKTFADLPFDWLKRVVESRSFEVPSDMERFTFAKEIVQLRARNKHSGSTAMAGEENVLLAFGANKSGGSGVTIVRKAAKGVHHSGVNGMGGGMGRQGGYPPQRTVWKAGPGL